MTTAGVVACAVNPFQQFAKGLGLETKIGAGDKAAADLSKKQLRQALG